MRRAGIGRAGAATLCAAVLTAAVAGTAQAAGARSFATNLPGTRAFALPPAGFDPLRASDAAISDAGLPPRPDALRQPTEYAEWLKLATTPTRRIMPILETTTIRHGPVRGPRLVKNANPQSTNWSGLVLTNSFPAYSSTSFSLIYGDWVVPPAQEAFGSCDPAYVYSSSWVGIDGYNSNDVLQAGTESDANCVAASTAAYYYAWYEWYPYTEVRVSNFTVSAGDDMFVEVWSTSNTDGRAYIEDYTTNTSVSLSFTAKPGTTLQGNSAEWIVERPQVGNSLSTLTNYSQDFFTRAVAFDFNKKLYSLTATGGLPSTMFDMIDNTGDKTVLSKTTLLGGRTLWFQVSGPAKNSAAAIGTARSTELAPD